MGAIFVSSIKTFSSLFKFIFINFELKKNIDKVKKDMKIYDISIEFDFSKR